MGVSRTGAGEVPLVRDRAVFAGSTAFAAVRQAFDPDSAAVSRICRVVSPQTGLSSAVVPGSPDWGWMPVLPRRRSAGWLESQM